MAAVEQALRNQKRVDTPLSQILRASEEEASRPKVLCQSQSVVQEHAKIERGGLTSFNRRRIGSPMTI